MTPHPPARLGYLVPEFPGQTHAFFQREIEALDAGGVDVELLSTTGPATLADHPWAADAAERTTYLASPGPAGAWRALRALARAMVTGRLAAALRRAGDDGGVIRAKVVLAAAALAGHARLRGIDHVHVHSCGMSAQVARVWAALDGGTFSLTLHGPLVDYGPHQAAKWRDASFGLAITERLRADLAAELGVDPASIPIAPMGIRLADTERAQPYAPWEGRGEAVLFSCGRLNVAKGHDTLVRAVSILADEGLPVRLDIAGEDEHGGAGHRLELQRLIDELGVADRVRLLGAVGEHEVRARLESAHVFVLASRGEPLGVAIMEAMGAAVPVVVGDGGGVRELVADGTGILAEPGNPRAFAAAVRSVLTDPPSATAVGERARERVRERFTSESSARVLWQSVQAVRRGPASATLR